jgi:hypothetical protein
MQRRDASAGDGRRLAPRIGPAPKRKQIETHLQDVRVTRRQHMRFVVFSTDF